jgi:YegS/Rv2252/BmrU family lipid kinase
MTDHPVSLFINPTAGRGRAGLRLERIQRLFESSGVVPDIVRSSAMGDLEDQVARHVRDGVRKIVVVGGDGSVHEAVNGLQRAGKDCALGLIPSGTGNDFAKACGITLDWEQATRSLVQRITSGAPVRKIDIGRVNGRYFANGLGIGFDAKVTRVARSYRWNIGDLVYLLAILRCLYDGVATPDMNIRDEHINLSGPVTLATVCNGPWVGGMFHIAPGADNADGKMDLLIAKPVSRMRILTLLPLLMRGKHMQEPEIIHQLVRKLTVTSAAPVESHLDGEVQALQTRFDIEVLPAALNLL